jgi:iron(II)-dependent oxidoreductase
MNQPSIFISYSHKDEAWKERLVTQLRVLALEGAFNLWEDRQIVTGDAWKSEIEKAINGANLAILLISADFLTSNFIRSKEVPPLLQRRNTEGMRIFPIILKPCPWKGVDWLTSIQVRPKDGKALALLRRHQANEILANIAMEIRALLLESQTAPSLSSPQTSKPVQSIPTPPDRLTITTPFHLELVRVPAGEFLMGSDPAKDENTGKDEQPQHRVYVSEFYIGKYLVTNAQYAVFVKAMKYNLPRHWKNGKIPSGQENHPVIWVSWNDTVAFCEWLSRESGRVCYLPTEAEWEKAARGTDDRIFPWGNEWDPTRLNSREKGPGDTTPVGKYSPGGDSPCGAADMAGNVWEWCADWYDENEYQRRAQTAIKDPQGPPQGQYRVLRGGSWSNYLYFTRCACRNRVGPSFGNYLRGVRVAVSPI